MVAEVEESSDAAKRGLKAGDIIIEIGFEPVRNAADYRRLLTNAKGRVRLRVLSEGSAYFIVLSK